MIRRKVVEPRSSSGPAWQLATFSIACALAGAALLLLNGTRVGTQAFEFGAGGTVLGVSSAAVGGLIASRTGNRLGWIFLATGLSQGFDTFATQFARLGADRSLPGTGVMEWFSWWTFAPGGILLPTLALLLFPDGLLPGRRWRPVVWAVGLAVFGAVVPVAVAGAVWGTGALRPGGRASITIAVQGAAFALTGLCMLACLASAIMRFRKSDGIERQQFKWLVYGGGVVAIGFPVTILAPPSLQPPEIVSLLIAVIGTSSIPVAVGIAILRHRLYDIDDIINRTAVYLALSICLGLAYYASVVVLQSLIGGRESPPLVIAASTLAAAALFRPARAHIQSLIDRRFNRRKYNAALTIEEFSARLRDEIDLDSLTDHLLQVVRGTMEPAQVSLWLRSPGKNPQ